MGRCRRIAKLPTLIVLAGFVVWGCGDSAFFADEESEPEPFPRTFDSDTESETGPTAESDHLPGADVREASNSPGRTWGSESGDGSNAPLTDPSRSPDDVDGTEQAPPTNFGDPIVSRVTETNRLEIKNVLEMAIPYVAYIHVHEGGVLYIPLNSIPPGGAEIAPAPKESPDQVVQRMEDALVDSGYSRQRAETIVEQKRDALFEEHGSRVGFVSPDGWVQHSVLGPVGRVDAPAPPWK